MAAAPADPQTLAATVALALVIVAAGSVKRVQFVRDEGLLLVLDPATLDQGVSKRLLASPDCRMTQQSSAPDEVVKRDGNRDGGAFRALLHDVVAAMLADHNEIVFLENLADLGAGEDSKSTQPAPRLGLRRLRFENAERPRTEMRFRRTE